MQGVVIASQNSAKRLIPNIPLVNLTLWRNSILYPVSVKIYLVPGGFLCKNIPSSWTSHCLKTERTSSHQGHEGKFTWANGDEAPKQYWSARQPDNYGGKQNCAVVNYLQPGKWDDQGCHALHPFVCQYCHWVWKRRKLLIWWICTMRNFNAEYKLIQVFMNWQK